MNKVKCNHWWKFDTTIKKEWYLGSYNNGDEEIALYTCVRCGKILKIAISNNRKQNND